MGHAGPRGRIAGPPLRAAAPPRTGRLWPWTFQSGGDIVTLNPEGALSVQDAESQHRAVLHGAGIGQIASYYAAPHIRAGRLRPVSIGYVSRQVDVHLYLPQRDHIPALPRAGRLSAGRTQAQSGPGPRDILMPDSPAPRLRLSCRRRGNPLQCPPPEERCDDRHSCQAARLR